jgi:hypothetical protein
MPITQFTELLTQAGKLGLHQRLSGTYASAENERVKACEELLSALDRLILTEKAGKQMITYHALYAQEVPSSLRFANVVTEKGIPLPTWQQFPKAMHGKSQAISL